MNGTPASSMSQATPPPHDRTDVEPRPSWFHRTLPFLRWVPTDPYQLRDAEEKLWSYIQGHSRGFYVDVGTLNGQPCRIWTRQMGQPQPGRLPLVMIHGMASGGALFGLNLPALSRDRLVYTLDLPGFARSSRPSFDRQPPVVEDQYITLLEAWRQRLGLERVCLLGHSFGAYLATAYSLRYPERVGHLICADPWGFSVPPTDIAQRYRLPWYLRAIFSVARHFNPLAALRGSGPYGPPLIKRFRSDLVRRFRPLFETDEECLACIPDYIYHCNAQTPSGEAAFHSLMSGFAWAKQPMLPRLSELQPNVPLTIIYGGLSWVTAISTEELDRVRGSDPNCHTVVKILDQSSHHVYADESDLFNETVMKSCVLSDKHHRGLAKSST